MQCLTCTPIKELTAGAGTVVLGTVAETSSDVYVYVKNTATKQIYRQSTTTDGDGTVTLDLTDPDAFAYHPNATFEIWVTLQSADIGTVLSITIGASSYECLAARFVRPLGSSNTYVTDATQTVQICS